MLHRFARALQIGGVQIPHEERHCNVENRAQAQSDDVATASNTQIPNKLTDKSIHRKIHLRTSPRAPAFQAQRTRQQQRTEQVELVVATATFGVLPSATSGIRA